MLLVIPDLIFSSTVLESIGLWNILAVREIKIRILNKENEMAMRRVRIPTILTEYERVVIRLIRKVSIKTRMIDLSMGKIKAAN
jgi:hypothetical protein